MTNFSFIHNYIYSDYDDNKHYKNLSYRQNKLYSYNTVIGIKFDKYKLFLVSFYKYSNTTAKHLNYLTRAIPSTYNIVYCDVDNYRDIKTLHKWFIEQADHIIKNNLFLKSDKKVFKYPTVRKDFVYLINQWLKLNECCKNSKKVYKKYIKYYEANEKYQFSYTENQEKRAEEARKREIAKYEQVYNNIVNYVKENNTIFGNSTYENQQTIEQVYNHFSWEANNLKQQRLLPIYRTMCRRYLFNNVYEGKIGYDLYPYPYHVYLDKENDMIRTTGHVTIERKFFSYILALMHVYLYEPEALVLKGKHVGPFVIINNTKDFVQIGCHRLLYKNVELLYKDLKEYLNGKEIVCE